MGLIHQAGGLAGDPGRNARREKHVITSAPVERWAPTWPAKNTLEAKQGPSKPRD